MNFFTDEFVDQLAEKLKEKLAIDGASKKLLSLKSAAVYLDCSDSTMRNRIESGEFPPRVVKRIGRRQYFVKAELDRWIEALQ